MFRRRKTKNKTASGTRSYDPPQTLTSDSDNSSPVAFDIHHGIKTSLLVTDTFKDAIEKAADISKNKLATEGKVNPVVFFVQADKTMKTVSLSLKNEYQKEAIVRRIREKALAEDVSAVIILLVMHNERQEIVLTGVSPGMRVSAQVSYSIDSESKTVTSWKICWLDQPVESAFIDGIFETIS